MMEDAPEAFLFIRPSAVPDRWQGRAISFSLVPLLPEEAEGLLTEGLVVAGLEGRDEAIAKLTARGLSIDAIAKELGVSDRTIVRRLEALHKRFGTTSKEEIALLLAERGFSR